MTTTRTWITNAKGWNGYVVGLFALLAGIAFGDSLRTFVDVSREALTAPPPQPIDVNQLLLRPFLLRVGMAALLVLPLLTAGVHAGQAPPPAEPSSPRLALNAFLSAMRVYAWMLFVSAVLVAVVFVYGAPEIAPVLSGYLGLLLMGSAFIASALLVSSMATSAIAAGFATLAISLVLAASAWLARSGDPAARGLFQTFSAGERLDDFAKGVIDTAPVLTCAAMTVAALFLTARGLDAGRSAR